MVHKYKFQPTEQNLILLDETAKECNLMAFVNTEAEFTVCCDCILFPSEEVGLKNALMVSCKQSFETCILCGEE